MNALDSLFPPRPIKIIRPAIAHRWQSLLAGIFLIAAAIGILYVAAPSLTRDYLISQSALLVEDADIAHGRCLTKYFVVTDCSADIAYNYAGQHYAGNIELMFLDFSLGDYTADVVISSRQPALATLSLGIDKLYNRILACAAIVLLFFCLGIYGLIASVRLGRAIRKAKTLSPLRAVSVEIGAPAKERGRMIVEYVYKPTEKAGRKLYSTLAKDELPFFLNAERSRALAVIPADSDTPVLLDQGLTRLDLTHEERRRVQTLAPTEA